MNNPIKNPIDMQLIWDLLEGKSTPLSEKVLNYFYYKCEKAYNRIVYVKRVGYIFITAEIIGDMQSINFKHNINIKLTYNTMSMHQDNPNTIIWNEDIIKYSYNDDNNKSFKDLAILIANSETYNIPKYDAQGNILGLE